MISRDLLDQLSNKRKILKDINYPEATNVSKMPKVIYVAVDKSFIADLVVNDC